MIIKQIEVKPCCVMTEIASAKDTLACEYSRLSFAPATTCKTRRETSAIHGQKFHTDDVNLSGIRTGALIGQLGNLHNVCEI